MTVTDPVTGTDIKWSGPNASNLYLDAGNRRAWTAGNTTSWSGGSDVTAGIDWTSEPLLGVAGCRFGQLYDSGQAVRHVGGDVPIQTLMGVSDYG